MSKENILGKNKREENLSEDPDWHDNDCLKLIETPQTDDRSYADLYANSLLPGNIFRLIKFTNHTKNIVVIDPTPLNGSLYNTKGQSTQPEDMEQFSYHDSIDPDEYTDTSLLSVASQMSAASQMSDDSYAIDDDDNVLHLPASLFVKVKCDEPAHIISSKPIRKAPQEALPPQEAPRKVTQEYGIISPTN